MTRGFNSGTGPIIAQETFTLANGVAIPRLGFGTWMINDGDVSGLVNQAIAIGYRHIDIRYCLELGLLPLPKTTHLEQLRSNAALDFEITAEDMTTLKAADHCGYGEADRFPLFSKRR